MREIVHLQAGQCGNQIGAKVGLKMALLCVFYFCKDELHGFLGVIALEKILEQKRGVLVIRPKECSRIPMQMLVASMTFQIR